MEKRSNFWKIKGSFKKRDKSSFEISLDYPLIKHNDFDHKYNMQLFFFPPASLSSTASWKSRDLFYQNLKSNLRWHTPEESTKLFKFPKTKSYLKRKEKIKEKEELIEDVIGENKLFANRLIKKLKNKSVLAEERAENILELLLLYRETIIFKISSDKTIHDQVRKHCCWCDEYLSYYFKTLFLHTLLKKVKNGESF